MESIGTQSTTGAPEPRDDEAVYNERGVIADNYHELQGLGVLDLARQTYPLPKASGESLLRAIFQSAEIALLNLADVTRRATDDLEKGKIGPASVKLSWARGFHRLLTRLSAVPQSLGVVIPSRENKGVLGIHASPAFAEYVESLNRFDRVALDLIRGGALDAGAAISERSLDDPEFHLLHLARVCNHEATIWEQRLREVFVPAPVPSYKEFVVSAKIRDAVYDHVLKGDTYFTQFRGLHQIPETLGEEVNDCLEEAIRALRNDDLQKAVENLTRVNKLVEVIAAAVPPMADNLATSDYHEIRENLGLTSGSHSVCLRFHMFTHLYEDLSDELAKLALRMFPGASDVEDALRRAGRTPGNFEEWLLFVIGGHCLSFRASITEWRDEHVHMPRNNLGGAATKSLTGSPDAVKAVKQMRDSATNRDQLTPLLHARDLPSGAAEGVLSRYFDSEDSLDFHLLTITGNVTQRRFVKVQERLGFFANRCPFSAPPRRTA
jgi:tryptophan 2,3-dioxygenase